MDAEKIVAVAVLVLGFSIAYVLIFVFPYGKSTSFDIQNLWQKKSPEEIQKQLNVCLADVSDKLKNINLKNLTLEELKKTLANAEKEKNKCTEKYK